MKAKVVLAVLALMGSLLAAPEAAAAAVEPASGQPAGVAAGPHVSDPADRLVAGSGVEPAAPDLAAAAAAAQALGEPVEVLDATTPTQRHVASPDGLVRVEMHAVAQRVRKPAGWVPVDTELRLMDGRVVPGASVLDVSFSAGGDDELVRLVDGGREFGLAWPDPLPHPVLSGDTATYQEVLPGIDLVLRVGPESFSQVLRVKTRQAAQHPRLERIAWQVSTTGGMRLRQAESGAVQVVDGDRGEVLFSSPESVMWDSPPPLDPQLARLQQRVGEPLRPNAEFGPSRVAEMPVQVGAGELAVIPDAEMLHDPETVFPVMIDPPFQKSPANWAPVLRSRPNDSWDSGSGQPRDYVRVGDLSWSGCGSWCGVWRSHLRFSISEMKQQELVGNPTFRIKVDHTASCGDTPVELWRTSSIGSSGDVTWNDMSSKWRTNFGSRDASANEGACPEPDEWVEWSTSTMRSRVQSAMDNNYSTFTFGLRAPNESDKYQWKRLHTGSATLVATYNVPPDKPTNLAIADCYRSCGEPAFVRSRRPQLSAKVSDPNDDQLERVQFQVRNDSKSSVVATGTRTNVADGSTTTWTPGSNLPQNARLHLRVRAKDDHDWGSWSSYFTFTVDTTPPQQPTVSSELYLHKDTGTWNGGAGQGGPFKFNPNSSMDVIEYGYRWLDGDERTLSATAGEAFTATVAPPSDLEQVLQVRSVDRAGNTSNWVDYPFYVRPRPAQVGYWKFDEGTGTDAAPTAGQSAYTGQLRDGATWASSGINPDSPGASGTAVSLDGESGYVEMPRTIATNQAAGFSVTAWAKPDDLSADHTVVAQNGTTHHMFRLHYSAAANAGQGGWCFTVRDGDSPQAGEVSLCAPAGHAEVGAWTHLAAAYDRPAGVLRLWVDGGPDNGEWPPGWRGETSAPDGWVSNGAFQVGRALTGSAGEPGAYWSGLVDEVRAHQRVLEEFEIQQTFLDCRYANCPDVDQPVESCQSGVDNDFNGDGFTDIAIADPNATVNGRERAGRVHVVFGGGVGSRTLSQADGFINGGPEDGDRFGFSLATVDYNGDGCTDLVVGAPFEAKGTMSESGFAQVLYGSPSGFGPNGQQSFSQDTPGMPGGAEAGDRFSYSIAAGTTEASEPYLVFGVPGEDIEGQGAQSAGAVNYVRGDTKLLLHQGRSDIAGAAEPGDQYGYTVAGSSRHVAVGTPHEGKVGADDSGTVHVFTHDVDAGNIAVWNQGGSQASGAAEAGDRCGESLSMVDYIPAGAEDERSLLVLGCPGEALGDTANAGRMVTVEARDGSIVEIDSVGPGNSGVPGDVEEDDYFGQSVGATNRAPGSPSTWRDLQIAAGIPGEDSEGESDNGDVQVFSAIGPPGDHNAWVADGDLGQAGWQPTTDAHLGEYLGATTTHLYISDPRAASPAVYAIPWQNLTDGAGDEVRAYRPGADGLPTTGVGTFGGAVA